MTLYDDGSRLAKSVFRLTLLLSLFAGHAAPGHSEDPAPLERNPVELSDLAPYEPSPAYPFGRPHPQAPQELSQFAFMIGEFDCVDEIRSRDGTWNRTVAIWNAAYFLNGYGIQDQYWCDTFATSNIRIFDPSRGKWVVNFFQMPTRNVGAGQWIGAEESGEKGRKMVMWSGSPDRRNGSRLTFYDITDDGFEWVSESLRNGRATPGWRSSCRRRKPGGKVAAPKFLGYDASLAQPYGLKHPQTSPEVDEFSFLLGRFQSWNQRPGSDSAELAGLSTASRILNGWAIQDRIYRKGRFTTTLRLFDPTQRHWRAIRFQMPNYECTVWDGKRGKDGSILLRETAPRGAPRENPRTLRYRPLSSEGYEVTSTGSAPPERWVRIAPAR